MYYKITALLVTSILFSVGCATSYSPDSTLKVFGGYQEKKREGTNYLIGDDVYDVKFEGNGYISNEKVMNYCLLRCAELTIINNKIYFEILDIDTDPVYDLLGRKPSCKIGMKMLSKKPKEEVIFDSQYVKQNLVELDLSEKPKTGTVYEAVFIKNLINKKYYIPKSRSGIPRPIFIFKQ